MYIASQADLEAFAQRASSSDVLAIDTEFLREKTYYPKLCLLQMSSRDEAVIVDPFAVDDLTVLCPLLEDDSIVKVFHSGHQDVEIMVYELDCVPHPIFDTQVAAALLGQTQQVGYAPLVHSICGVKLKKTDSFTDWSVRPLSDSQIEYALDDVVYLPEMYSIMKGRLEEKGRLDWLADDFEEMTHRDAYITDEQEMYRRLKHVGQLSRRQMAAAREMAAWREIEARKRNIPRRWVLTDEQIVEACKREPRTIDDLFMVRGIRERLTTADARALVELVRSALDSAPDTWPELNKSSRNEPNVDVQVGMLMSIVRMKAREHDIALQTLASMSDLTSLARGHRKRSPLLKGWRRDIVGNDLLAFLEGRTVLCLEKGKPRVKEIT